MESNFPSLREAAGAGPRGRQAPPAPSRGGPPDGGPPAAFAGFPGGGSGGGPQQGPPREFGFVAGVKEGYGFIRCLERDGQLFFHSSEVMLQDGSFPGRGPLSEVVSSGDEVEFSVQDGAQSRNGRPNAVRVRVLPRGTLRAPPPPPGRGERGERDAPPPHADLEVAPERLTGRVVRELRGGQRRRADAYGGRVSYAPPGGGPAAQLDFTGADVDEAAGRLAVGDEVTFAVATDRRSGEQRATAVAPVAGHGRGGHAGDAAAPPGGADAAAAAAPGTPGVSGGGGSSGDAAAAAAAAGRDVGRVAQLRDSFGFVRVAGQRGGGARLFFHFSQLEGCHERQLAEGSEISFLAAPDRRTGKTTAQQVRLLPPGSLAPEPHGGRGGDGDGDGTPSRSDAASWARAAPATPPAAEGGDAPSEHGSASGYRAPPPPPAPRGGNAAASAAAAAAAGAASGLPRELGAVVVLKDSYGFIKCCERPTDLFFHFSALVDASPDTLAFGQDVEFTCVVDGRAGKPIATRVTLAPKGAAVFETVAEARVRGVCRERLPAQKGYPGRGEAEPHGVIELLPPEATPATSGDATAEAPAAPAAPGEPELLSFFRGDLTANMQPRPGDAVEFSVATDRRTGARHATRIALQRRSGVVVLLKPGYGFVELAAEEGAGAGGRGSRLFFHSTEVEGGVTLKERDECDFFVCLNAKTGEPNARKLRRTKEAPPPPPQPERPERPERDKAAAPRTTRMAEGPDGTPGFGMGRGKTALQYGTQSKLSVAAQPFVPADAAAAAADPERHADAAE